MFQRKSDSHLMLFQKASSCFYKKKGRKKESKRKSTWGFFLQTPSGRLAAPANTRRPQGRKLTAGDAGYANSGRKKASPEPPPQRAGAFCAPQTSDRARGRRPRRFQPAALICPSPIRSWDCSQAKRRPRRPFTGPRGDATSGGGASGRDPRGGRGEARSAQARQGRSAELSA